MELKHAVDEAVQSLLLFGEKGEAEQFLAWLGTVDLNRLVPPDMEVNGNGLIFLWRHLTLSPEHQTAVKSQAVAACLPRLLAERTPARKCTHGESDRWMARILTGWSLDPQERAALISRLAGRAGGCTGDLASLLATALVWKRG